MAHVLVIHSHEPTRTSISQRLTAEGHHVEQQSSARAALEAAKAPFNLVLLEHTLPDASAQSLLPQLKSLNAATPVIVLATPTEEIAPTLREGAYFCTRIPLNLDEVLLLAERAFRSAHVLSKEKTAGNGHGTSNGNGASKPKRNASLDDLLGDSPQIQAVKHAIQALAASPQSNVLLIGESGTGKDLVARIIHSATAPSGEFLCMSCSTLPEALLEAELFGTADAAPGAEGLPSHGLLGKAEGGTIFLDEIEALPSATQAKLVRFAEDKIFRPIGAPIDCSGNTRIIAATRRDVQTSFAEGRLREDLLHRLAVVTIQLPPLRECKPDIPDLVRHYLTKFAARLGKRVSRISGGALNMLQEHSWPGNVRELCNTLERALLLATGETLESTHISFSPGSKPPPGRFRLPPQGIDFRELEREVVAQALELAHGNQTRAASLLHMTRDQIRYRMAKFGITEAVGPAELALDS